MTQTQEQNVPALRFPEFAGEWENSKLSKHIVALYAGVSVNSGDRPANKDELGILKTSAVTNGVFEAYENKVVFESHEIKRLKEPVQANTIIISRMNTPALVGANAYIAEDHKNLFLPDRLWAAKLAPGSSTKFISYILGSAKGRSALSRRATGTSGSMKNITKPDVLALRFATPTLPEQQKIAAFLSSVDRKIAQLGQKKALLQQYKKGMMQKLFSQELRFKDAQGHDFPDWEEKRLGEEFEERAERNISDSTELLSVTLSKGIIPASELGRHDTSPVNKSKYKKVCEGDIAYNSMRMWQGASGVSKHEGIVSPAYTVIKPVGEQNTTFFSHYFKLTRVIQTFQRHSQGLTSDTWNLKFPALSKIKLPVPIPPEQKKIADFLSSIDRKIDLVADEIDHAKAFKKGLLQQMFF